MSKVLALDGVNCDVCWFCCEIEVWYGGSAQSWFPCTGFISGMCDVDTIGLLGVKWDWQSGSKGLHSSTMRVMSYIDEPIWIVMKVVLHVQVFSSLFTRVLQVLKVLYCNIGCCGQELVVHKSWFECLQTGVKFQFKLSTGYKLFSTYTEKKRGRLKYQVTNLIEYSKGSVLDHVFGLEWSSGVEE